MKALTLALFLIGVPTMLDAGTLMKIRILHEKIRGISTQTITVSFWPAPPDRALHLIGFSPDHFRASSVPLLGIESPRRAYTFIWKLPPSTVRDEGVEPYTIVATTTDAEGNITGSVETKFFVLR